MLSDNTSPQKPAPLFVTERITKSTKARAESLIIAVNAFRRQRQMDSHELAHELNYSASGTRKYINDLCKLRIIEVAVHGTTSPNGKLTEYRITQDNELIERFVDELNAHIRAEKTMAIARNERHDPVPSQTKRQRIQDRFPDRHIHLASDDMNTGVRFAPNEGEGKRDPLVAAFFGSYKPQPHTIDI